MNAPTLAAQGHADCERASLHRELARRAAHPRLPQRLPADAALGEARGAVGTDRAGERDGS